MCETELEIAIHVFVLYSSCLHKPASLLVSSGEKILFSSLARVCPKYLAYLQVLVHNKTLLKTGEQSPARRFDSTRDDLILKLPVVYHRYKNSKHKQYPDYNATAETSGFHNIE